MPSLFIISSPKFGQCRGIILSTHSTKTTPFLGYVNGKEDVKVAVQFNALFIDAPSDPNLENEAEEIAFGISEYSLSGEVGKVEKNCLSSESTNQSVSVLKAVLNVVPQSIFYTAAFQYHIWHSGYLDVEFNGFMGNFKRDCVVAAKKRALKSGDPILFSIESNSEKCGIAILEPVISDSKWNASLYLIDAEISQFEGMRLISKKTGGFERESTGESVRSSFETDFATVEKILSHTTL